MKLWMISFLACLLAACASDNRKLVLDGDSVRPTQRCGTQSYLNRYANYRCDSIELENTNNYVNQKNPIHNIKDIISNNEQHLLVVEEKIFGAQVRQKDQEVLCNRRLKVVLNPGVGRRGNYQQGWITYKPKCFRFYKIKPAAQKTPIKNLFSKKRNGSRVY